MTITPFRFRYGPGSSNILLPQCLDDGKEILASLRIARESFLA